MTYFSPLMLDIIWMLTREDKPKLEGSIRCALQQRTRGMTPYRWTPLHFLAPQRRQRSSESDRCASIVGQRIGSAHRFRRRERQGIPFSFLKGLSPSHPSAASSQVTDGDQASRQVPNTLLGCCTFNYIPHIEHPTLDHLFFHRGWPNILSRA